VVIEANSVLTSVTFAYYANTKKDNTASYWLKEIAYDDEESAWDTETVVDSVKSEYITKIPAFYYTNASGVPTAIIEDFADYNIYASTSTVDVDVNSRDYVYLANNTTFRNVPVYTVSYNDRATNDWVAYSIDECESVHVGDELIYVTNGRAVQYAINVTQSTTGKPAAVIPAVEALYDSIDADAKLPRGYAAAAADANEALSADPQVLSKLQTALKALEDIDPTTLNGKQGAEQADLIAKLEAAIKAITDETTAEEAAAALVSAYQTYRSQPANPATPTAIADKRAALEALYAAAVADKANIPTTPNNPLTTEEIAYNKAVDEATAEIDDFVAAADSAADLDTLSEILAASTMDHDANAAALVLPTTASTQKAYDAAVAAVEAKLDALNAASALIKAYDEYHTLSTAAEGTYSASEIAAALAAFKSAVADVDALSTADKALVTGDTTYPIVTGSNTTAKTAYDARPQDGNITKLELVQSRTDEGDTITGDATNGYVIHLADGVTVNKNSTPKLNKWLTVTGVAGTYTWEQDTTDETGLTWIITDAGKNGGEKDTVKVTFQNYVKSKETAVATIYGRNVTNNAVTLASTETALATSNVSAASKGSIVGISITSAEHAEDGNSSVTLLTGTNTLYVTVKSEDQSKTETLTITVTVQS
jgi:hypothetical protein